jgi:hypothetical protein
MASLADGGRRLCGFGVSRLSNACEQSLRTLARELAMKTLELTSNGRMQDSYSCVWWKRVCVESTMVLVGHVLASEITRRRRIHDGVSRTRISELNNTQT